MNYFIDYNLKNGLGHPSISLYLTGCDKEVKCEGCHNEELQASLDTEYDIDKIKLKLKENIENFYKFSKDLYVCILGGEPLTKYNKPITIKISEWVKKEYPDSILVLYSWRYEQEISGLNYFDYGVLGGYEKDKHLDFTIPSSSNQYIWDFKNNKKLDNIKLKGND